MAWLLASVVAGAILFALFRDKPLVQTEYLAVDTASREIVLPRPKPLAVSHYQKIAINDIEGFTIARPNHQGDDGSLCATVGQESVVILDVTSMNGALIAQIGKWLAVLCEKGMEGSLNDER